ncbi:MAG: hypothetical protein LBU50_06055 [Cellulomonas sp.]|jgi:hypothetical protein|nr:hypothetical protein [Cellulomonas sp.]
MFRLPRTLLAGAALAVGLAGLAGCSSSSDDKSAESNSSSNDKSSETNSSSDDKPSETPRPDAVKAEWATALTVKGDKLTTIEVGDLIVDVYQVGTAKSTKEMWVLYPDFEEPVLEVGVELVVVNYVVTNVGSKPVPLSRLLVDISVHFDSSENSPEGDSSVLEAMGLDDDGYDYNYDSPYILEPGQAYSVGDTFQRLEGNAVTFSVDYTPATADGELDQDNRVDEVEAKATLK